MKQGGVQNRVPELTYGEEAIRAQILEIQSRIRSMSYMFFVGGKVIFFLSILYYLSLSKFYLNLAYAQRKKISPLVLIKGIKTTCLVGLNILLPC